MSSLLLVRAGLDHSTLAVHHSLGLQKDTLSRDCSLFLGEGGKESLERLGLSLDRKELGSQTWPNQLRLSGRASKNKELPFKPWLGLGKVYFPKMLDEEKGRCWITRIVSTSHASSGSLFQLRTLPLKRNVLIWHRGSQALWWGLVYNVKKYFYLPPCHLPW